MAKTTQAPTYHGKNAMTGKGPTPTVPGNAKSDSQATHRPKTGKS